MKTEPERMLQTICRLNAAHEMFLQSYPEDIKTPEGQRYCINNLIRETKSLLSDLSYRLIVEKDIEPEAAQDTYILIMNNACELMDKYQKTILSMIDVMEEGDNNEML